ncbi:MAG TPA: hypothetical protein VF461_00505 [Gemmatimonadaceae bacterium]
MMVLSFAAPSHRAAVARCEPAYCRCIPPAGVSVGEVVRGQRERSTQVVLGRVVRVDTVAPQLVQHGPANMEVHGLAARVSILRVWKGPLVDTLTVDFGSTPVASSCDLSLEVGRSYVIFATRDENGVVRSRVCNGTTAEDDATATISALGPAQEPKK